MNEPLRTLRSWNDPACAVEGCLNNADPRWLAHDPKTGRAVLICDGHDGTPCKATTIDDCTCPTRSSNNDAVPPPGGAA